MFKIHVNNGRNELPKDDIFYIVAKDGIYIKKTLGIMDSLVPVKNISTLEDIESTAKMNIKKIPGGQFAKIISFFKEVHKEYGAEAIVLLFYNEKSRTYRVVPPVQKVSAAALDYDRGLSLEGWSMIGDVHSHASMSAFHSGTDHDDELSFDGLHITIGNLNDDNVSLSASIVSNGHRVIIEPEEYINHLVKTKDVDETKTQPVRTVYKYCQIEKKMVQDKVASSRFGTTTYRTLDKRYKVDIGKKYFKVPNGWMDMVTRKTYAYQPWNNLHYQKNQHNINNWDGMGEWGYNFNPGLWDIRNKKNLKKSSNQQLKLLESPQKQEMVSDENDVDNVIPCATCKFKEFKLLEETNAIEDIEYYQCVKCDSIWHEDALINGELCPICITDDFLFLYENDEPGLTNNYVPDDKYDHLFIKDNSTEVKSDFIKCSQCGETFRLHSGDEKCPFCYGMLNINPSAKDDIPEESVQEEDMEKQMKSDAGEFLGEDIEDIQKAAKEEIDNILV